MQVSSFDKKYISEQVNLADKNWFKTGGSARFFAAPACPESFAYSIAFAHNNSLPLFILGQGANILISDTGFDGLVIQPQLTAITHTPKSSQNTTLVTAQAGVTMESLITYCLDNNIVGLEEFSGIPGTVGGSVYINLHYYDFLLEDFLVSARVLHAQTGEIISVDRDWFQFGYNSSTLHNKQHYLVDATFELKHVNDIETAYAKGRRTEIIRHRVKRYPSVNTCGSFFRNFSDDEVTLVINNKKMIYAAYYLDKIGVKGALSFGGAVVSHQHANMLVNQNNATTDDIITLARTLQERVHHSFGVMLQPECQLIGFNEYPLLQ